jgi:hypothetical protein
VKIFVYVGIIGMLIGSGIFSIVFLSHQQKQRTAEERYVTAYSSLIPGMSRSELDSELAQRGVSPDYVASGPPPPSAGDPPITASDWLAYHPVGREYSYEYQLSSLGTRTDYAAIVVSFDKQQRVIAWREVHFTSIASL